MSPAEVGLVGQNDPSRCDGRGEDAVHAKSAAPVASALAARHWTFDRAALGGLTLFVAPPGHLLSEGLFEALQRQGRPVIWVRLGPEDRDPATFLRSLVAAVQRHHPGFGFDPLSGPAGDPPASLVAEHAHHLGDGQGRPCSAPSSSRCWSRTGPAS
jgi:hypothetical protein